MAYATFAGAASPSLVDLDSNFTKAAEKSSGTFTPNLVGGTAAGTATFSVRTGAWRRVGDIMHLFMQLNWTGHNGTGQLRITGLPVNHVTSAVGISAGVIGYQNLTASNLTCFIDPTNNALVFNTSSGAQNVTAAGNLVISVTYPVA